MEASYISEILLFALAMNRGIDLVVILQVALARESAASFPRIPECPGHHWTLTVPTLVQDARVLLGQLAANRRNFAIWQELVEGDGNERSRSAAS